MFTVIDGKFKFQVQDSGLEYCFLENWKTPLQLSEVTPRAPHALQGGSKIKKTTKGRTEAKTVDFDWRRLWMPPLYSLHWKVSTMLENTEHKNAMSSVQLDFYGKLRKAATITFYGSILALCDNSQLYVLPEPHVRSKTCLPSRRDNLHIDLA